VGKLFYPKVTGWGQIGTMVPVLSPGCPGFVVFLTQGVGGWKHMAAGFSLLDLWECPKMSAKKRQLLSQFL
jgi:hypothetical protein